MELQIQLFYLVIGFCYWIYRLLKFIFYNEWMWGILVNGEFSIYYLIMINYFYQVEENHTISKLSSYDNRIKKLQIGKIIIDIENKTMDNQDVFLDDISLS